MTSTDAETNTLSIFQILEELSLPKDFFGSGKAFPLQHEIVSLWERVLSMEIDDTVREIDVSLDLIDPDEKVLHSILTDVKIPIGKQRHRVRIRSNAIPPMNKPGKYHYLLRYKDKSTEVFERANCFDIPLQVKVQ